MAYAEQANQLMPGRPALMDTLAAALAADRQLDKAVAVQKQAVERAPEDGQLRLNLAKLYIKADQKGMARGELERIGKLGRNFPQQEEVSKLLGSL